MGEVMEACCPATPRSGGQADCAQHLPLWRVPWLLFISFFDDCTDMLGAPDLTRLTNFYANCQELDSCAQLMLDNAEPAMIFRAR